MRRSGSPRRAEPRETSRVSLSIFPAWLRDAGAGLLVVLACAVAYLPTRSAGFIQDDHPIVDMNPVVHRGDLGEIFSTDYWGGVGGSETNLFRPITILSFVLERGADGRVNPARAHLVNVVIHALASLALAALALRLGSSRCTSLLAGVLFAVHPIHVSVVAGLVGRAEMLALLFIVLALLAQSAAGDWDLGGTETPSKPRRRRVAAWSAAAFVFLALGSKEVAVCAPLLLVAFEAVLRPRPRGGRAGWLLDRAAALAPTALAVVGFLVLRTHALGVFPGTQRARLADNLLVGLDGIERAATALGIAGRSLRLLVFPHPLSADYSGPVIATYGSLLAPLPLLGLCTLASLTWLAVRPIPSRRFTPSARRLSFASLLFLLPYLVVGNLLVLVGIAFAERLLYVPSSGFCLLLAIACTRAMPSLEADGWIPRRPARAVAVAVVVVVVISAATWRCVAACRDWKSDVSVMEASARATPASPRVQFTLGKIRLDQGRPGEALPYFERATQLWPNYSWAWYERGLLELRPGGDAASGEESLRRAVRANPMHPDSSAALAEVLAAHGRWVEAERFFRRAVRLGRTDLEPRLRAAEARGTTTER